MQIPLRVRDSAAGSGLQILTNPVDVSNMGMLILSMIVYSITGTGATIAFQFQTSDDLETWELIGNSQSQTAAGYDRYMVDGKTTPYGRYVRVIIQLSGTACFVNYSAFLNTFQST